MRTVTAGSISARFEGQIGTFSLEVAFEAPMQGITALFGPSGSGKTTVLRCMAGLQRMSGRLDVGEDLWQNDEQGDFLPAFERQVGYVFQESSLFPHLTVRQNLLYGARRATRRRPGPKVSFDDTVALLGIGGIIDRSPAGLSGGEGKRVAIGRALLSRPRLLLMDEPLAGLDEAAKEEVLGYLERLHPSLSVPVVYVSHDLREVARLADTIVVLSGGRTSMVGPLRRVLEELDRPFGSRDFENGVVLRARVVGHDRDRRMTRLVHQGQEIVIPAVDLPQGQDVRLRIRARDVVLACKMPSAISVRNILRGTILQVMAEEGTAFAEALVDVGGGRLRSTITRDAVLDLALEPGKPVYALIKSISFDRPAPSVVRASHGAERTL